MTNTQRSITAVLSGKLSLPMSPENISSIPLYHIHYNLWNTILLAHGEPGVAQLLETTGDKVFRFEILPDTRFSNGREMNSEDILFSVNRLLSRQSEGHFNVKGLIEKITATSKMGFEITLKEHAASFLFLLSIPEMGIVPREACESNGDIKSLDITSGAYSVLGQPETNSMVLAKNKYFKRNIPESPDQVKIIFKTGADKLFEAANTEHPDFIEIYESNGSAVFRKIKNIPEYAYKATRPSYSVFLVSNTKNLSLEERLAISELVHDNLPEHYPLTPEIEKPSYEILPPKTFGSLGLQEYPAITKKHGNLPTKIRLACFDKNSVLVKAIAEILTQSNTQIELVDLAPGVDYDIKLLGQGMNADFPEIEFHLNMVSTWAYIDVKESEKETIVKAIHSNDKKERAHLIQKIGQSLLDDGRVIPLIVRSYVHVYRKNTLNIDRVNDYDGDISFGLMKAGGL